MSEYLAYLETLPACAEQCLLKSLELSSHLDVPELLSSFCKSESSQRKLTECVAIGCNATEQYQSQVMGETVCFTFLVAPGADAAKAVEIAIAVVGFVVVILRLMSRIFITKKLGWDDYLIILTALFLIPFIVLCCLIDDYFKDVHTIAKAFLFVHIADFLYLATQTSTKISILLFYMRIFPQRYIKIASWVVIGFQLFYTAVFLFLLIFRCHHLSDAWAIVPRGYCLNFEYCTIANAACSIAGDLVVVILPIPILVRLNMGWQKKVSLVLLFSLCSFACVTSIVRFSYIAGFGDTAEAAQYQLNALLWSEIENFSATICACLPFLRPMFTVAYQRIVNTVSRSQAESDSQATMVEHVGKEQVTDSIYPG